jgi:hypothetical protein
VEGSEGAVPARAFGETGILAPAVLAAAACAVASVAILASKFVLAERINVNWDEFYFLTQVYALARGELDLFLQGAYAHAFLWVTGTGGDEVDQVVILRFVMCGLLAVSAGFTYALTRLQSSRAAACAAVLAFLASWPVLKHGASFRADALLLPLTVAAFYFTLRGGKRIGRDAVVAGACLGLAFVVSVKAVLLLPALVVMATLPDARRAPAFPQSLTARGLNMALTCAVAAGVAAILLVLHRTQVVDTAEQAGAFAARTFATAVLEMPFFPRRDTFMQLAGFDLVYWIAAAAGFLVALRRHALGTAAAALCFAPLLFYRNAFPYYFPVMMAPAAILVAIAFDSLLASAGPRSRRPALAAVAVAIIALLHGAWDGVARLRFDGQSGQRAVVAAVHRVFPQPVPYIDHSGMIASFPKANFFMSGWGVERYLDHGRDFVPESLERRCPPLLLVNQSVLKPGALLFRQLRAADRALLESRYVEYWGPIRVAGAATEIRGGEATSVRVPCSGRYRVASHGTVLLDDRAVSPGEVIELEGERDYRLEWAGAAATVGGVELLWADARKPPSGPPPKMPLYAPL